MPDAENGLKEISEILGQKTGSIPRQAFNDRYELLKNRHNRGKLLRNILDNNEDVFQILEKDSEALMTEMEGVWLRRVISDRSFNTPGYMEAYENSETLLTQVIKKYMERSTQADTDGKYEEAVTKTLDAVDTLYNSVSETKNGVDFKAALKVYISNLYTVNGMGSNNLDWVEGISQQEAENMLSGLTKSFNVVTKNSPATSDQDQSQNR